MRCRPGAPAAGPEATQPHPHSDRTGGHRFIQELRVYVPVAGLLRENIRFTLSNVELVSSSPESWQTPKRAGSKAPGRREEGRRTAGDSDKEHDAGGWATSMMNRIALNIRVEVRNMVFKFRTDKYVSSVSWQSLTFDPCDPSWRAGFVNVSGETKAAFKTLTLKQARPRPQDRAPERLARFHLVRAPRPGVVLTLVCAHVQVTWCLDAVGNDLHRSYEAPIFNRQNVTVRILSRSRPAAAQQHPAVPPLSRPSGTWAPLAISTPTARSKTCPVSTEGGTRRVHLVREGGGRGSPSGRSRRCAR